MQSFGISSKLVKCTLQTNAGPIGSHAANIVRINGAWHILDATNPLEDREGKGAVTLFDIKEHGELDTNSPPQTKYTFTSGTGKKLTYEFRNDMFIMVKH